jgi:hypothetical protein
MDAYEGLRYTAAFSKEATRAQRSVPLGLLVFRAVPHPTCICVSVLSVAGNTTYFPTVLLRGSGGDGRTVTKVSHRLL